MTQVASIPRPVQIEMDYLLAHCYPLITSEEAAFLLDCHQRSIENLVADGTLPAVNLALEKTTRNMIRIWRWAVLHVCLQPERPMSPIAVGDALPHSRAIWLVHETASLFRCSEDHVHNLVSKELLAGPDRNAARPGTIRPRIRIWRETIITLLQTRTIA